MLPVLCPRRYKDTKIHLTHQSRSLVLRTSAGVHMSCPAWVGAPELVLGRDLVTPEECTGVFLGFETGEIENMNSQVETHCFLS